MSLNNRGNQTITYKYSTPLQAEYLNTLIANIATQGIITTPKFSVVESNGVKILTISPFSVLINLNDNNENNSTKAVKLTTNVVVQEQYINEPKAVVVSFSFTNSSGIAQSQWYADFRIVSKNETIDNDEIVIGVYIGDNRWTIYGSDFSSAYLIGQGLNYSCYFDLVSPRNNNVIYDDNNYYFQLKSLSKGFDDNIKPIPKGTTMYLTTTLQEVDTPSFIEVNTNNNILIKHNNNVLQNGISYVTKDNNIIIYI